MNDKIRFAGIKNLMSSQNIDGLLITNPYNIYYLTDFIGLAPESREAHLLISDRLYLFLYPTYKANTTGNELLEIHPLTESQRLAPNIQKIIADSKLQNLGFEKNNLTVAELDFLKNNLRINLVPTENIIEEQRIIKQDEEITKIKKAAGIADQAFKYIQSEIKESMSEKSLAFKLECFLREVAGDISFSPIIGFNENSAIAHHISSKNNILQKNSLILLDFGAKYENYCSDITRIIFYKTPSSKMIKLYETVLKCQKLVLETIKIGQKSDYTDQLARDFITSQNYPPYPHGLGHGVGLEIHENPRLRANTNFILKENMVVTIEPAIYLEGKYGVRIEDLLLLKKEGVEILSKSSKSITIIK